MKILIVEDNPINARIIELCLRPLGVDSMVACDGRAGLKALEEERDIALIVLDVMMPEMDGIEFLTRMRENPEWEWIPVVMCTALGYADVVADAVRLGCEHYVLKPIDPNAFLERVRSVLEQYGTVLRETDGVSPERREQRQRLEQLIEDVAPRLLAAIGDVDEVIEPAVFADLTQLARDVGAERVARQASWVAANCDQFDMEERQVEYRRLWTELRRLRALIEAGRARAA